MCADAPRPTPTRAGVLGEFGGVSCNTPGHEWDLPHSFTYRTIVSTLHPVFLPMLCYHAYIIHHCSGLPPQEAPIMIAEKRKVFFSFLFIYV